MLTKVRRNGPQQLQHCAQALVDDSAIVAVLGGVAPKFIAELHHRGHGGIKGLSPTIIIAHFGDGFVDFTAQIFLLAI